MSYAVKEMFLTLQGEGMQAGRRAVFIRFAGCNLWSGREADRPTADCRFCDTDFVGIDGDNGGRYADADALAARAAKLWDSDQGGAYAVLTGGEPMLQVDAALIAALKIRGFEIAIETNGTLPVPEEIDWICVSPKAGTEIAQRSGDELKLVWPQTGMDLATLESWDFGNLLIQPMDGANARDAREACIRLVMTHPKWRLSLQNHKIIGLR